MTTITGLVADLATTDQDIFKPFLGVTITGSGSFTVQATLSSPQFPTTAGKIGTLSNLGGGIYVRSTGVYSITGTAAQITTALDGLVFTPAVNQVGAGQTVSAAFTVSAPADPTFSATSNLVITDIGFSTLLNSGASALALDGAGNLFGQTSAGGLFELPNTGGVYASTATGLPTAGGPVPSGAVTGFIVDLAGDVVLSDSGLVEITPSPSGYHPSGGLNPHYNNQTYVPRIAGTAWDGLFVVDETHSDELVFAGFDTAHFNLNASIPVNTNGEFYRLGVTGVVGQVVADQIGTTAFGTTGAVNGSLGSVFSVHDFGFGNQITTLATFTGANGADPRSGLTIDAAGNMFGTTFSGGAYGLGTVFEIDGQGQLTTLASFNGADGANPVAGLLIDGHGDLWGTTSAGGAANDGTVFEIATTGLRTVPALALGWPVGGPTWNYATTPTTIVTFTGSNGAAPVAGLTADDQGHVFGSTTTGGSGNAGTVFEIADAGFVPTSPMTIYLRNPVWADLTTNPFSADLVSRDASFLGLGYQSATVQFSVDGSAFATTGHESGPDGYWELNLSGLADGRHTVVASETDPLGYGKPISASLTFTLDAAPPVVTARLANDTGASSTDRITSADTLTGSGDPNALVQLTVDGAGATTMADASGNWTFAPTGLLDGPHTVVASETDVAHLTGSASLSFTLDTTKPAVTEGLANDTGIAGDLITSDDTLSGSGDANAVVQLTVDGVAATTVADPFGNWTFAPAGLGDGPHTVTVSETDAAGNTGSASLAFTLDTTAPATSVSLAHDTGASSADRITSDDSLSGSGDANAVVQLTVDGVAATTVADPFGNWTFAPSALGDGPHTVTVSETDAAGNTGSASLAFTLDTTAPATSVSLAHDTGASSADRITSDDTLSGSGDANAVVQLDIDGVAATTVADPFGNWTFAPAGLGDGPHTVTVGETDAAGNTGSASLAFALDTTAPAVTVALAHDTGASSADRITSDDSLSGSGDANAVVQLTVDGVAATTMADPFGNWTFAPAGLGDGPHTVTVGETDAAGNTGSASITFTLDTTAPAMAVSLAHDTGASSSDTITSDDTLSGTGDPNAVVQLDIDDAAATTVADPSGNWTFAPAGLGDGPHTVIARETDAAGNTGTASVTFTLDTAAPAVTASLANDTGASSTDGITSDDTLSGTGDPNAMVQLDIDGAAATTMADPLGNWTFAPAGLGDGPHTVTVGETDTAGNTGSVSLAFMLDRTAPVVTASLAHDTGASSADGLTADDTLSGTGDPNALVQFNIDGASATIMADPSGNWTFAPTGLADGPHTVTVSETDAAGNAGSASLAFTLDTTAPVVTQKLAHDTGASAADGITSDGTLSGTGDPGALVQFNVDGVDIAATTMADPSGSWTFAPAGLADGPHTVVAREKDAAGNTGSASLTFRLDTTPPAVTIGLAHDTGASSTDRITSDDTLTGSGDANAVVRFKIDGADIAATTTADPLGNWTFAPAALGNGPHTVVASETDAAGNTGSASLAFTLALGGSGPVAGNAHLYTNAGLSVDLTSFLLAQDSPGSAGGTLSISAVNTAGTHGTVSLSSGKLNYTAPASGSSDAFTYTVSDQLNETATGIVNVSLVAKNASVALTGSGNDVVLGNGNYSITGGTGGNAISLGNGNDSVSLLGNNNTVVLGNGNDTVSLSGNNNTVTLGNGNHSVATGAGSRISLGNGNDTVSAGANSTIALGNGNDTIYAGANTKVALGNGNDTVYAGANDAITLGAGHDTVAFGLSPGPLAIGNETVANFAKGDVLEFNHLLIANYAAAMFDSKQVGQDTVITVNPNDTVTLHGTALSSLTASAFKFV